MRHGRVALAESMAAASTALLNSPDPRPLDDVLHFVQRRNADLRSVGLRARRVVVTKTPVYVTAETG